MENKNKAATQSSAPCIQVRRGASPSTLAVLCVAGVTTEVVTTVPAYCFGIPHQSPSRTPAVHGYLRFQCIIRVM
ncbi:MAG: hypothetical protein ACRDHZ_07710, partial [Ktedonobacteraceae bacterium]